MAAREGMAALIAAYRATTAAADRAIDDLELDTVGKHWSGETVSLRSMLPAVPVDAARHAGHSDIMRDMIDGSTGGRHSPSGFYGTADEEYRSAHLDRVRGEIDTPDWWDYINTRGKQWS